MANKEELKNQEIEEKMESKQEVLAPIEESMPVFEAADAFAWREEESDGESRGQETIYANTGVKLQRELRPGADGKTYQNFGISFVVTVGGKKLVQTAYFNPPAKTSSMYDLLAAIFGNEQYYPVEIVKTVTPKSDTRPEQIRYSLRVSTNGDFGNKISCDMTANKRGDTIVFNNLIELLKSRGVID